MSITYKKSGAYKLVESAVLSKLVRESLNEDDLLNALESFIEVYKSKRHDSPEFIALSLFAERDLGSLEVIVKFMKENLSLNYAKIAFLLNRDQRTIWSTYNNAVRKHRSKLVVKDRQYMIPCKIFSDRRSINFFRFRR